MAILPEIPGYRIEKELGKGGMARVFLAWDEKLERHVALKSLLHSLCEDDQLTARFVREAKTAAKLKHTNIVSIYDVGQYGQDYYFTMELLEDSLKQRLAMGPMDVSAALNVFRQVVSAVEYAHRQGLIHRDLKPDNIMFRGDGTVVLVDFGIARTMDSATKLTKTGMSIGTPHYMSPEQARGQAIDSRSDLYSLGIVFYEMLLGCLPYQADESIALALLHIQAPIPTFPEKLSPYQGFLNKMLAKTPEERFQSGQELLQAISEIMATQGPPTSLYFPPNVDSPAICRTEVIPDSDVGVKSRPGRNLHGRPPGPPRQKSALVAILGILLILLTVLAVILSQKPARPDPGNDKTAAIHEGGGGLAGGGNPSRDPAGEGTGGSRPIREPFGKSLPAVPFEVLLERVREALNKGDADAAAKDAAAARTVARDDYQKIRLDNLDLLIRKAQEGRITKNTPAHAESVETGLPTHPATVKSSDPPPSPSEKQKDAHAAGEKWREPKTGIEMVFIPSGEFVMGSNSGIINESPAHVVIVRGFWIGRTELTQGQWQSVVGENPSRYKNGNVFPVETVSWDKVKDFIRKLNEMTGVVFRLPSEAEWEFACRSGSNNDRYGDLDDIAWYRNNSGEQTHAVGEKRATPWGLADMLGNVWEWCEDYYEEDYYKKSGSRNPQGPTSGEYHVIRGGSWFRPAEFIRARCRNYAVPGLKNDNLGFRLAKD